MRHRTTPTHRRRPPRWRSWGPGCGSGRRPATSRSRPCRGAASRSSSPGVVVAIALVVLVIGPAVNSSKQEDADRRAKAEAAAKERRDAIARRDQRARTGGDPSSRPPTRPPPGTRSSPTSRRRSRPTPTRASPRGPSASRTRRPLRSVPGGTPRGGRPVEARRRLRLHGPHPRDQGEGSTGRLGYPFRRDPRLPRARRGRSARSTRSRASRACPTRARSCRSRGLSDAPARARGDRRRGGDLRHRDRPHLGERHVDRRERMVGADRHDVARPAAQDARRCRPGRPR